MKGESGILMDMKKTIMNQEDLEMEEAFREGIRQSVQEVLDAGHPIVKYDYDLKKPYFLYPNGEKKYAY